MTLSETIAALATPSGEAALAVLRISGPQVPSIIKESLGEDRLPARLARLCRYRSCQGRVLDRLVAIYYAAPHSYTGEEVLEIFPHGNPFLIRQILEDLGGRGCRLAEPGEFTKRAFLNGKMDLSQAEAVIDLIRARTDLALAAAHRQLAGGMGRRVKSMIDELIKAIAYLEAYLDFPEEDLPPESAEGPIRQLIQLSGQMEQLISTAPYTELLHEGVRVVIIGAPNAGKSSLLNALLGRDRALVSDEPGTTRDYLEECVVIGPYRFILVDTAGLRVAHDRIEEMSMEKTMKQAEQADLLLLVIDRSHPAPVFSGAVGKWLQERPSLIVDNKVDLPWGEPVFRDYPQIPRHMVSCRSGEGLQSLRQALQSTLEKDLFVPPAESILVGARHAEALLEARQCIEAALTKLRMGDFAELAATDLRLALDALGRITGTIDNERVLDELFATFCIGK